MDGGGWWAVPPRIPSGSCARGAGSGRSNDVAFAERGLDLTEFELVAVRCDAAVGALHMVGAAIGVTRDGNDAGIVGVDFAGKPIALVDVELGRAARTARGEGAGHRSVVADNTGQIALPVVEVARELEQEVGELGRFVAGDFLVRLRGDAVAPLFGVLRPLVEYVTQALKLDAWHPDCRWCCGHISSLARA